MRRALALDEKWVPAFAGMTLEAELRRRVTGATTPCPATTNPGFHPTYPHAPNPVYPHPRVRQLTRGTDEVPVDVTGAVVARLGFSRLTSLRLL